MESETSNILQNILEEEELSLGELRKKGNVL
jgi:hypothetical protein